jgi:glycosyltransferase involved in cell wall biosynthesis
MIINQWLAAAHEGDAIGNNARHLRAMLRRMGHVSDVYALTIDDALAGQVRAFSDPAATRGDLTILHFALASPLTEAFGRLTSGRILQYHNVTPAHFFATYDTGLHQLAERGRRELASLVGRVDLALGVSEFNRSELDVLGFGRTAVLPIAVSFDRLLDAPSCPALEAMLDDGLANILFVGRIAPNKRVEDHIRLAEHYKRYVDDAYRFVFVGRYDAVPRYYSTVQALVARYDMPRDRFLFVGAVPDEELATYYRTASAYLSLSEHEGFCVPLLEAMAMDVPVLAYGAAAIPETLGGAGIEFMPKDLEYAAEMLGMLVYDDGLRDAVIEGQRRRVAEFGEERIAARLAEVLRDLTPRGSGIWDQNRSPRMPVPDPDSNAK